jgi:hypothetical protein
MWSTHYSCQILMKLEFSRQIFEKYSNINFNEKLSSGSRIVPCGRTDMTWHDMTKLIGAFAMLRKHLKTCKDDRWLERDSDRAVHEHKPRMLYLRHLGPCLVRNNKRTAGRILNGLNCSMSCCLSTLTSSFWYRAKCTYVVSPPAGISAGICWT